MSVRKKSVRYPSRSRIRKTHYFSEWCDSAKRTTCRIHFKENKIERYKVRPLGYWDAKTCFPQTVIYIGTFRAGISAGFRWGRFGFVDGVAHPQPRLVLLVLLGSANSILCSNTYSNVGQLSTRECRDAPLGSPTKWVAIKPIYRVVQRCDTPRKYL